jgi:ribosomal silencing factor RsfS
MMVVEMERLGWKEHFDRNMCFVCIDFSAFMRATQLHHTHHRVQNICERVEEKEEEEEESNENLRKRWILLPVNDRV